MRRPGSYRPSRSRPREMPNQHVAMVCRICHEVHYIALVASTFSDMPRHCHQPMLIQGAPRNPGIKPPSVF